MTEGIKINNEIRLMSAGVLSEQEQVLVVPFWSHDVCSKIKWTVLELARQLTAAEWWEVDEEMNVVNRSWRRRPRMSLPKTARDTSWMDHQLAQGTPTRLTGLCCCHCKELEKHLTLKWYCIQVLKVFIDQEQCKFWKTTTERTIKVRDVKVLKSLHKVTLNFN